MAAVGMLLMLMVYKERALPYNSATQCNDDSSCYAGYLFCRDMSGGSDDNFLQCTQDIGQRRIPDASFARNKEYANAVLRAMNAQSLEELRGADEGCMSEPRCKLHLQACHDIVTTTKGGSAELVYQMRAACMSQRWPPFSRRGLVLLASYGKYVEELKQNHDGKFLDLIAELENAEPKLEDWPQDNQ